jgi:hypothetical protein
VKLPEIIVSKLSKIKVTAPIDSLKIRPIAVSKSLRNLTPLETAAESEQHFPNLDRKKVRAKRPL